MLMQINYMATVKVKLRPSKVEGNSSVYLLSNHPQLQDSTHHNKTACLPITLG